MLRFICNSTTSTKWKKDERLQEDSLMRRHVRFNITEINGTEFPHEWFARKVREFAKYRYGMNVSVEVIDRDRTTMETRNEKEGV